MKNIQKICTILTLVAFNSLGCFSALAQTVSSDLSSVLENPVTGQEVTLRGKFVGTVEDCHVFSDGTNKILVEFEEEELSYNPDNTVEISGTVQHGVMHEAHSVEEGHYDNVAMDTVIMVNQLKVITANE